MRLLQDMQIRELVRLAPNIRELNLDELIMVSGGDDGGCTPGDSGADGNCASQGDIGIGAEIPSLPEVTVTATQDSIGDADAENLVNNIDASMGAPAIGVIFFAMTLFNWIANAPPFSEPFGNPMGDQIPAGP
ncbi:MAG: hypothetical protein WKG52_11590 [Variovorax sp.]